MKLAIIFNENKLSGKLTKLFTGCYAYHVAWVDEQRGKMYDMHLIRRRRKWPHYNHEEIFFCDFPEVSTEYLEDMLDQDEARYGVFDYLMFIIRPIFHIFGVSTRNVGGVICSEMINNDIWECGGSTPWHPSDPPPSPCDFYRWLLFKDKTDELIQ